MWKKSKYADPSILIERGWGKKYFIILLFLSFTNAQAFLFSITITTARLPELADNLIGLWRLNDNPIDSANSNVTALVGSNAALVPYGGDPAKNRSYFGKINESIAFWNGGSSYAHLNLGNSCGIGTNSYTVNLWWKTASTVTNQCIMNDGNWGSTVDGLSLQFLGSSKDLYTRFKSGSSSGQLQLDIGTPAVSTWYMLTLTVDRSTDTITLYHNGGASSGSASIAGFGSLDGSFGTFIGSLVAGGGSSASLPFIGFIDDISVWTRALSPAEVAELYSDGDALSLAHTYINN